MLRKKSLTQQELIRLARSKGKSKAKNSLRSIINSKTTRIRNDQSLKDLNKFSSGITTSNRKKQNNSFSTGRKNKMEATRFSFQNSPKFFCQIDSNKLESIKNRSESKSANKRQCVFSKIREPLPESRIIMLNKQNKLQNQNSIRPNKSQNQILLSPIKITQFQQNQQQHSSSQANQITECNKVDHQLRDKLRNRRQQKYDCNSKGLSPVQNVLNQQMSILKQYISYLQDQNNLITKQLNRVKQHNQNLLIQIIQIKQNKNFTQNTLAEQICQESKSKQFSINEQCKSKVTQLSQSQEIQTQEFISSQQISQFANIKKVLLTQINTLDSLKKLSTLRFGKVLAQFLSQQISTISAPLQKQNSLLRQLLQVNKKQILQKQKLWKNLLLNAQKGLKQLMSQFKIEQHNKKKVFSDKLEDQRKLTGISALFS